MIKADLAQGYDDILLRYKEYCNIKREFELNQTTPDALSQATQYLCNEIYRYLSILISNIDTKEEKQFFVEMLNKIKALN